MSAQRISQDERFDDGFLKLIFGRFKAHRPARGIRSAALVIAETGGAARVRTFSMSRDNAVALLHALEEAVSEVRADLGLPRPAARLGIGAVVAMVAAARMALGGWYGVLRRSTSPVTHWDFAPAWMTNNALPACGDCWLFDHGLAADLDDVDCPDCLAMARRAGVLREVT